MKLPTVNLCHSALLLVFFLTFPVGRAAAQTTNIPARITQVVDEKNLVVLSGNVHPLALLGIRPGTRCRRATAKPHASALAAK